MAIIDWETVKEYEDITFRKADGVARIAFNRPEVRNAFRPKTVSELLDAFHLAEEAQDIGVILLTGEDLLKKMVVGPFVQGVINVCVELVDTKVKTE